MYSYARHRWRGDYQCSTSCHFSHHLLNLVINNCSFKPPVQTFQLLFGWNFDIRNPPPPSQKNLFLFIEFSGIHLDSESHMGHLKCWVPQLCRWGHCWLLYPCPDLEGRLRHGTFLSTDFQRTKRASAQVLAEMEFVTRERKLEVVMSSTYRKVRMNCFCC